MDFAFGLSTTNAPSYSSTTSSSTFPPVSLTGGAYPSISGDFLLRKNFGVMGEISWKSSQGIYDAYQPYRPIFWDFNGVYVPELTKHVAGVSLRSVHWIHVWRAIATSKTYKAEGRRNVSPLCRGLSGSEEHRHR